jgi:hypothetical protein
VSATKPNEPTATRGRAAIDDLATRPIERWVDDLLLPRTRYHRNTPGA